MAGLPLAAIFLPSPPLTDNGQAQGSCNFSQPSVLTPPTSPVNEKRNALTPSTSKECPPGADTYRLGASSKVAPLVSLVECRHHLRLLGAFAGLRDSVFAAVRRDEPPPNYGRDIGNLSARRRQTALDPGAEEECQKAWRTYLARASHRFELWLSKILTEANLGFKIEGASFAEVKFVKGSKRVVVPPTTKRIPAHCLPPIDVLIIYHAYLLNPACAFEDIIRLASRKVLSGVEFPAQEVAEALHGPAHMPHLPEAQRLWELSVNEPWELSLLAHVYVYGQTPRTGQYGLNTTCPDCKNASFYPWILPAPMKGLSEPGWQISCSHCQQNIDADTLRGAAFLSDLEYWCAHPHVRTRGVMFSPLDGSLFAEDLAAPIFAPLFQHAQRPEDKLFSRAYARTYGEVGATQDQLPSIFVRERGWSMSLAAEGIMSDSFVKTLRPHITKSNKAEFQRRINFVMSSYVTADPLGRASLDLVSAALRQCSFVDEMAKLSWSDSNTLSEARLDGSIARAIVRYHRWLDLMFFEKRMLVPTLDIDLVFHSHLLKRRYASDVKQHLWRFIDHNDKIEEGALESAFQRTAKAWHSRYKQPYTACGCYKEPSSLTKVVSGIVSGTGSLSQRFKAAKSKSPSELSIDAFIDAQHPSTHNSVIVQDDASTETLRQERKRLADAEIAEGKRRANHEPAFVYGYGYTPLVPYIYVPGYSGGVGACVGSFGLGSAGGSACCGVASCGGSGGSIGCGGCGGGGCGGGCGGG